MLTHSVVQRSTTPNTISGTVLDDDRFSVVGPPNFIEHFSQSATLNRPASTRAFPLPRNAPPMDIIEALLGQPLGARGHVFVVLPTRAAEKQRCQGAAGVLVDFQYKHSRSR